MIKAKILTNENDNYLLAVDGGNDKEIGWLAYSGLDAINSFVTSCVGLRHYTEYLTILKFEENYHPYNSALGKFKDKKALASWDLEKLPNETKKYVEDITKDVLAHNSASSSDILADLWQYSRWWTNSPISSIA